MTIQNECPVALLTSGQTIKIRKIQLFEEERVNEISLLRAKAMKGLGGVSTGIGFWGSPSWALGGAAALGIVEGFLSNAARKQALELIQIAIVKANEMALLSQYFDPSDVINSESPYPQTWHASSDSIVHTANMGWGERSALLSKYQKAKSDIVDGKITVPLRYVHDGDDFVNIETDVGRMSIRWQQHVVAYSPAQQISVAR
jgi:hypothetical protein